MFALPLCLPAIASRSDDRAQELLSSASACYRQRHYKDGYALLIKARSLQPPPRPFVLGQVELWVAKLAERIGAPWSDRAETAAYQAAADYLREARRLAKSSHEAALAAGHLGRAWWGLWDSSTDIDDRTRMADEAMRWYSTAISSGQLSPTEHKTFSDQLQQLRKDEAWRCANDPLEKLILNQWTPGRVIPLADRALGLDPRRFDALLARGEAYRKAGYTESALRDINAMMVAVGKDSKGVCVFRMLARRDAGDWIGAPQDLITYVAEADNVLWPQWTIGQDRNDIRTTRGFLDRRIREFSDDGAWSLRLLYLLRGAARFFAGDTDQARQDLSAAEDLSRSFPGGASGDDPFFAYLARDWLEYMARP